ncbi:hypothetical protein SAMN05216188_101574 [Lentzea xinjiangensis]|uniref:Uncharacterized protein n=1 Tax=Lentzea xinjiangensis TaxID=402600 RepID=A0A1H9AXX7_9PSEU|nr:hypothetical protein [Lentzea xinjiangensis]SEP81469.1 hypothetical protein SAMN05216188_101574 [Lentzea xinjiangensis]
MASGGAGALLLRAAALGGLTAAAWLLGGTTASADVEEPPPAVEIAVDAVPAGSSALVEDPAAWVESFTAAMAERNQPVKIVPPAPPVVLAPEEPEDHEDHEDEEPTLDFTSGKQGNTRFGTVSNQAPPEVLQAKAQVRAAKKAAQLAVALPPPPPPPPPAPPVVVVEKALPLLPGPPAPAPAKTEPAPVSDFSWTVPGPAAPLPAPQQAPVVAAATTSTGHTDNSGGTRGVHASLTSHDSLFPPTSWSVEERRDGRCPGSLPGLPSTSPD